MFSPILGEHAVEELIEALDTRVASIITHEREQDILEQYLTVFNL